MAKLHFQQPILQSSFGAQQTFIYLLHFLTFHFVITINIQNTFLYQPIYFIQDSLVNRKCKRTAFIWIYYQYLTSPFKKKNVFKFELLNSEINI